MVFLSSMCRRLGSPGVVAVGAILCCPYHNGVVAIVKLVLLPLSQWHCRHRQCAGVFAAVMIVSSPLLCCCQRKYCMGVIALVAPASSSLLHQPIPPHVAWVSSPSLHQRYCPIQAGVFVPLHWCPCPCHTVIVPLSVLALAPSLCRPLCHHCACIVNLQANLPSLSLRVLSHGRYGRPRHRQGNTSTTRETMAAQQGQQHQTQ
jgi:hypothetical protein